MSDHTFHLQIWHKLCLLIDGVAISSTVSTLRDHGILQKLSHAGRIHDFSTTREGDSLASGYLRLAFRLLEDQGFLLRKTEENRDSFSFSLSQKGRGWYEYTPLYSKALLFLEAGVNLHCGDSNWKLKEHVVNCVKASTEFEYQVRLHVVGPLVAAFLVFLYEANIINREMAAFSEDDVDLGDDATAYCLQLLADLGWLENDTKKKWFFSAEGKHLFPFIPQLFYPVSYLKTAIDVPHLLFPQEENNSLNEAEEESHIDRNLDITFSGLVYERNFREPVHEILNSLFDNENLDQQPRYIVDSGSGDGTLLLDVYKTIAQKTIRGKNLESHPLTVVGIEYNRVAEQATAKRLCVNNIPFITFQGDIGQPEKIAQTMTEKGIALSEALHVSKSVIHNRVYCENSEDHELGNWQPRTTAVFIDANGTSISSHKMALNLVGFFKRWKMLVKNHGMIVIEAHAVSPASIADSVGKNILTFLDSSHGYSHQYLVEKEFFYGAIQSAGYAKKTIVERSVPGVEESVLTVNYLFPLD